jgi:carbon-monoxide dehydrogenase small subunit
MPIANERVRVTVNGVAYERNVEPRLLLSDFLRQELGLTGTHVGCEHGVCGMCTILLDGRTARSCLAFAVQTDGCQIRTVEGLGTVDALHAIQEAFWEKHGLQCGYCTPAMLMTAVELIDTNSNPSWDEIREAVGGILCRCTGYQTIVEAVELAAQRLAAATASGTPKEAAK